MEEFSLRIPTITSILNLTNAAPWNSAKTFQWRNQGYNCDLQALWLMLSQEEKKNSTGIIDYKTDQHVPNFTFTESKWEKQTLMHIIIHQKPREQKFTYQDPWLIISIYKFDEAMTHSRKLLTTLLQYYHLPAVICQIVHKMYKN